METEKESLWISSSDHKRADRKDATFPGKGFLLEALPTGVTAGCGGGKKLIKGKKTKRANSSAHPGFGNGAGL